MNKNRARELVQRAMWHIGNNYWQTAAVMLELAYTEILELEERIAELEAGRMAPEVLPKQSEGVHQALLVARPRIALAGDNHK